MGMFDTPKAFAPFFDDSVVVEGRRSSKTVRTTCRACILDGGFADGDPEAVSATAERVYSIRILRSDWRETEPPRIGDTVTDAWNSTLKVTTVGRDGDWFELTCKSKGGPRHD